MNKDFLIGAGAGILVNRTIRLNSVDFWTKQGIKARDARMIVYNQAIKEGKSEEEAIKLAFATDPFWLRNLGALRVNGLATTAIGALVFLGNKNIGYGIMAAGAAKFIYPNEIAFLKSFTFK